MFDPVHEDTILGADESRASVRRVDVHPDSFLVTCNTLELDINTPCLNKTVKIVFVITLSNFNQL